MGVGVVLEIAETEVRQNSRAERLGYASGQTVIVNNGASCQTARAETYPTQSPETSLAGKAEIVEAITSEELNRRLQRIVNTHVESVLVVWARAGSQKVVDSASVGTCVIRLRELCQDVARLR